MGWFPKDLGETFFSAIGSVCGRFILVWILMGLFASFCILAGSACARNWGVTDLENLWMLLFFSPMYLVVGAYAQLGCFAGIWAGLFFLCLLQFIRKEDKLTAWGVILFALIILDVFLIAWEYFSIVSSIIYFLITISSAAGFWGGLLLLRRRHVAQLNAQADEMAMRRQAKAQAGYKNIEEDL